MGIATVQLVGNLTRDPELRTTGGGTSVCSLRLAVNSRKKDESGEWVDKPNYFDVSVFGKQGELSQQYLGKGSQVAVAGRLEWREWTDSEGNKRQSVDVVANEVQFIGSKREDEPAPDRDAETGGW